MLEYLKIYLSETTPEPGDWRAYAQPAPVFSDGPLPWEKAAVADPFDALRENAILKAHGVSATPVSLSKGEEHLVAEAEALAVLAGDLAKNGGKARGRRAATLIAWVKSKLALGETVDDLAKYAEKHDPQVALDIRACGALLAGVTA